MDKGITGMKTPNQFSPLVLAYIGDAIYEVYVRGRVLAEHEDMPAYKLHRMTTEYVRAHAQSRSMLAVEPLLNEREEAVYKRGRNAKSATVPKNADLTEYRRATGFEALVGWLHLGNEEERLEEIMRTAFEAAKE